MGILNITGLRGSGERGKLDRMAGGGQRSRKGKRSSKGTDEEIGRVRGRNGGLLPGVSRA